MTKTFLHKPNIGDVLYSLPVIRHLGGGTLYLDASPMPDYRAAYVCALSFLRRQPYLEDCRLYKGEDIDVDLDCYQDIPQPYKERLTLVSRHFLGLGIEPPKSLEPWLVTASIEATYPVIVHRTCRWNGPADYSFLSRVPRGDLFCIGYSEEAAFFEDNFGATWLQTPTMDKLASVIAACGVFIGNQSSPLALAVGLGKNRMLEECPSWPNCTFGHDNEFVLTTDPEENFAALRRLGYAPQETAD